MATTPSFSSASSAIWPSVLEAFASTPPLNVRLFPPQPGSYSRGSSHSADTMQLLDELAMIYTTCIMFYAIFSHRRATSTKVLIALLVVLLAVFITLYYHYLKDPLFHQNT